MYSSPLLHLVGGFLLFYARKTCSSPFYQSHRHGASQPETTICSYNQESKFRFRISLHLLRSWVALSFKVVSHSVRDPCYLLRSQVPTIAVLNWPTTQFHHLVAHVVFFVEWGMAEDWEMQIELRNCAERCFEIDISTIFENLKLIWEWMDELGQSSYIGKSAGRPWRAALYW